MDISTYVAHTSKHFGHFGLSDSCTQLAAFETVFNLNIAVWVQ